MHVSREMLLKLWNSGYSIAELWGHTSPVVRRTSDVIEPHGLLWGILRIAEDQINVGAGHRYFRERVAAGDWIGIGTARNEPDNARLVVIPAIQDAKFGRKESAIGSGDAVYVNARFLHARFFEATLRGAAGLEDSTGASEKNAPL